jgi:hypothetical protein
MMSVFIVVLVIGLRVHWKSCIIRKAAGQLICCPLKCQLP